MQNLKREKDRLSVENDSLREVNAILNRKEIGRIEKILKVKMKENK